MVVIENVTVIKEKIGDQYVLPEFKFIDLFAGIGGMRIAFEEARGNCVFSSEIDKFARQTYEAYFQDPEPMGGDITGIEASEVPDHDILVGGFPCQPFSLAGVSKHTSLGNAHGFEHRTQGTLFFDVARIIAEKRPRAFLLENVKNLVSHDRRKTFKIILETLQDELNYTVFWKIIDGSVTVPQHRERVYIVGFRDPVTFEFPDKYPQRKSLYEILDPSPPNKYTLSAHLWKYLQDYAAKHRAKGNGFGYGIVDPSDPDAITRTLSARYHKDGSEILVRQDNNGPRRLTPKECSALMGFPEGFNWPVSDTQAYRQFGNSVVVPVVEQIAKQMAYVLRNDERPANERKAEMVGV